MDLGIILFISWLGSFILVAVDSAMRGISPVFWRLAGLVSGPLGLVAYGVVRELAAKQRAD